MTPSALIQRPVPLKLTRDPRFGAAVLAAPIFWLWWYSHYPLDAVWHWPSEATAFLMFVVVYPVLEELVFRGLLQGALYERPWFRVAVAGVASRANCTASLVFSACHLIYHTVPAAGLVFFPSLIFGYFRDRYQSVLPAVILHVFYNLGFFWLIGPPFS